MTYFTNCRTIEALEREHKQLVKSLHPDCNPGTDTTAAFQQMQAEYERKQPLLKDIHEAAEGEPETAPASMGFDSRIQAVLDKITGLPEIHIEVVGTWIWIDGNTFPVKEQLKAAGFQWSRNRGKWHAAPCQEKGERSGYSKKGFSHLRYKYGAEDVETRQAAKIA